MKSAGKMRKGSKKENRTKKEYFTLSQVNIY